MASITLRRTFISTMLDAGEDVLVVSPLAGHAQVQTTPLHDRRGVKAEQAAIQRFAVPYMAPSSRSRARVEAEPLLSVARLSGAPVGH